MVNSNIITNNGSFFFTTDRADTLTKDNIRAYIKALYGGSSWEIIDGDETTTGVWQLVRTDL